MRVQVYEILILGRTSVCLIYSDMQHTTGKVSSHNYFNDTDVSDDNGIETAVYVSFKKKIM